MSMVSNSENKSLPLADQFLAECGRALGLDLASPPEGRLESDMDEGDVGFCIVAGLLCVVVSTNEAAAKWLEGVHGAASGDGGKFDSIQRLLGKALNHEGDAIDLFGSASNFVTRGGENAYPLFHRLLFGHDVLSGGGEGFVNDNPFVLMVEQKGQVLPGVTQAIRHLLADTMSKQGLPLPGSSYLDTTRENGRPWNMIIDWSQDLAVRAYGDKRRAEEIYERVFTVRFQDAAGSGLIEALNAAYRGVRGVSDEMRCAQIRLLSIAIAFFGEAAIGAYRQNGIPYVNNPMLPQLAHAYFSLIVKSGLETARLHRETEGVLREGAEAMAEYEGLARRKALLVSGVADPRLASESASELISFLEED